jgi:DnaJ-class molecular chaperone
MRDPYEILGVQRSADHAAIKSAYRRHAKKLHPDANKSDPKASSRFAELNAAYEILGDEDKRKQFDRGEIDAEGKPRFQGFEGFGGRSGGGGGGGHGGPGGAHFESFSFGPENFQRGRGRAGGFSGFEDILKDMFSGTTGRRGATAHGFEPNDFADAASRDVTVTVTISLAEAAQGGSRRVRLPTGKEVDVKIPAGLVDGQQIRLKGQGVAGPASIGDALITIKIAPHPLFTRESADLRLELPLTLYEAVLGGKVRVPTLDGAVELAIPAGTSSGRTFRLKGKGMSGKTAGDLLVTVRIVLPAHEDPELEELMRRWREQRPYDPRKAMD